MLYKLSPMQKHQETNLTLSFEVFYHIWAWSCDLEHFKQMAVFSSSTPATLIELILKIAQISMG